MMPNIYDYFASLAKYKACPEKINEAGLASGFVDGCTVWSCPDKPKEKKVTDPKNEARKCYMKLAEDVPQESLALPDGLDFEQVDSTDEQVL